MVACWAYGAGITWEINYEALYMHYNSIKPEWHESKIITFPQFFSFQHAFWYLTISICKNVTHNRSPNLNASSIHSSFIVRTCFHPSPNPCINLCTCHNLDIILAHRFTANSCSRRYKSSPNTVGGKHVRHLKAKMLNFSRWHLGYSRRSNQ